MNGILRFEPIIKRIRWGGKKLGAVLGKPIGAANDAAESWEIVDHGTDQSCVATGPWQGKTLAELVREANEALFGVDAGRSQFPLLIKFLDATDRLSVQVHPNDEQAKSIGPGDNGKTEAWVILDASPGSVLYAGLRSGVDRTTFDRALAAGAVEQCLHTIAVRPGDCLFIPAGTVHAIGEGVLLAEVQQSSDLTYRLHDWGRLGADGKPRPLHVEQSLACIDFDRGPVDAVVPKRLAAEPFQDQSHTAPRSHHHEELVRCDHFVLHRHIASGRFVVPNDDRCHILMCLEGAGSLREGDSSDAISRGQTRLLMAHREVVHVEPEGNVTLLDAFLP